MIHSMIRSAAVAAALAAALLVSLTPLAGAPAPRARPAPADEDEGAKKADGGDEGKKADGEDEGEKPGREGKKGEEGGDIGEGGSGADADDGAGAASQRARAKKPTEREERILALFHANRKYFQEGKLVLEYDLQEHEDDLLEDWTPSLTEAKPRIHWSTSGESDIVDYDSSSSSSSSRSRESTTRGLVVSDRGQWVHKAPFLPDVEASFVLLNVAIHRPGTLLGPIFYNPKKKTSIGLQGGVQIMSLSGGRLSRPLVPAKTDKVFPRLQRQSLGFRVQGKSFECLRNEKKVFDEATTGKLAEGYEVGHVGFYWTGSVQCFLFTVTIKGRLDPDWVAARLGETKKDPGTADKKKSAGKTAAKGAAKADGTGSAAPEKNTEKNTAKK